MHDSKGEPWDGEVLSRGGGGGGDLVSTLPGCVCGKVKDMGPFSASSE